MDKVTVTPSRAYKHNIGIFACEICDYTTDRMKSLTTHIKAAHKLSAPEYTIAHLYAGKQPTCKNEGCINITRYVRLAFKDYCKDCSSLASSIGGRKGGKAAAWNKGKTKETDLRIHAQSVNASGAGNHFYGKKHTQETRAQISKTKTLNRVQIQQRISDRSASFELVSDLDDYFSRQQQYLKLRCKKCETISEKTLQAFERGSLCQVCYPNNRSQFEIEINEYINTLNIETIFSDRKLIAPKELDIVVPSKKVAIEANGLYWHSHNNRGSGDKQRHLRKTKSCLAAGYKLIHIFDDEWRDNKDICKSMISSRLSKSPHRVFARKCDIRELSKKEEIAFFKASHISGFAPSRKCFGLIFSGKIVAAMSLRVPRQKKYKGLLEIARFASAVSHSVPGGLSRLLKRSTKYAIDNGHTGFLTYADRRFGEGLGYLQAGFTHTGNTGLDYWFTDGQVRIDRSALKTDRNKTEKQKMYEAKMMKIYGCGSNIYLKYFEGQI